MKQILFFCYAFFLFIINGTVKAESCCASQGGFTGSYNEEGYAICKDETLSYDGSCKKNTSPPKNTPEKKDRKGCMDKNAKNYSERATISDGSCIYYIYGCTNKDAFNYNEKAEVDDGSCTEKKEGCKNDKATNYDKNANVDNKSCLYEFTIVKEENIPFHTNYKRNSKMLTGEEKIIQRGIVGKKKIKYRVIMDDFGKEIKKEKIDEKIINESKEQWIEEGSKNSMWDFTLLLYGINFVLLIINFVYKNTKLSPRPYILNEIQSISYTSLFLTYLVKTISYIVYFLFSFVLLDFIFLIIYEVKKRI